MYCPESDPGGVVIVIVPFNLFEDTCKLVGALHTQLTSTLDSAIDIRASSITGLLSGFAVILVAKIFLFAMVTMF